MIRLPKDDGFIYVSARPLLAITPRHPTLPESLTQLKGEKIIAHAHSPIEISFDENHPIEGSADIPIYRTITSFKASMRGHEWNPWTEAPDGLLKPADGLFTFEFTTNDLTALKAVCDHRDPKMRNRTALKQRACHWGMQSWGGLTMEIRARAVRLCRCDVDVFTPFDYDTLSGTLFFSAISLDPVRFDEGRRRRDEKEIREKSSGVSEETPMARIETALEVYAALKLPPNAIVYMASKNDADAEVTANEKACLEVKCPHCGCRVPLDNAGGFMIMEKGGIWIMQCICGRNAIARILSPSDRQSKGYIADIYRTADEFNAFGLQ